MKRIILGIGLIVGGMIQAHGSELPQGSRFDPRIQYVDYNSGDVVIVRALPGLGTRIVFAQDEEILDVASGFTEGWQFSNRRNQLFLKPRSIKVGTDVPALIPEPGKWNTNLMVTTNRRLYDFDLRLMAGGGNESAPPQNQGVSYRVEFRYPADERARTAEAEAKAAAKAKLEQKPPPRNWAYTMQVGEYSDGIAPTMAYDDGRFTYLRFPNNRDFPSVFVVASDKTESIVNTHVDQDVLVVHRVVPELVLRLGSAVVGVYNDSFDPDGIAPHAGTTVPGIRREIK